MSHQRALLLLLAAAASWPPPVLQAKRSGGHHHHGGGGGGGGGGRSLSRRGPLNVTAVTGVDVDMRCHIKLQVGSSPVFLLS